MEEKQKKIEPSGKFEFLSFRITQPLWRRHSPLKKNPVHPLIRILFQIHCNTSRNIPLVSSTLTRQDQWGTIKARLGAGRMSYAIDRAFMRWENRMSSLPVLGQCQLQDEL